MSRRRKPGGSSTASQDHEARAPVVGKRTRVSQRYGASASGGPAAKGPASMSDQAMADMGFALTQRAIDALWEAITSDEPDVKMAAIQTFASTWVNVQRLGADDEKTEAEAHHLIEILANQLSQHGDGRMQLAVAEVCQMLGVTPPARAQRTVDSEARKVAKGAESRGSEGP